MSDESRVPKLSAQQREWSHAQDYKSLCKWLEWGKRNVWANMMADQRLRAEHMTFLLYGFLAETGLTPKTAMLVEKRMENGDLFFGYVKKDPEDIRREGVVAEAANEVKSLKQLVDHLQRVIKEQKAEIDYLKGKT